MIKTVNLIGDKIIRDLLLDLSIIHNENIHGSTYEFSRIKAIEKIIEVEGGYGIALILDKLLDHISRVDND